MLLLRRFLDANSRLSARLDKRRDLALFVQYDAEVAAAVRALAPGALVVDLGGGRECSFAHHLSPEQDVRIVAVDISAEELAANTTAHETRVADVAHSLPFADGEVDLLVSRTVLEHVDGVQAAAHNIARVLRPGGRTLHLVPGRYALFAIVARTVRFDLAKRVLHTLHPHAQGVVEFDVVYDHTTPRALERIFRAAGFSDVETQPTWDQTDYAAPLFPVFLAVLLYQRIAEALRIRALASYVIVRAVR
jgi:SAM-dependent methyltransferase